MYFLSTETHRKQAAGQTGTAECNSGYTQTPWSCARPVCAQQKAHSLAPATQVLSKTELQSHSHP